LIGVNVVAQTLDSFEIKLKKIEYIDVDTKDYSHVVANSTNNVLNLSRNYNHIFIALEDDPNIQYAYKFSDVATLSKWKNTGPEINIIGLSRGEYKLSIRGERNGIISSNSLEYYINIKPPFYLTLVGYFYFYNSGLIDILCFFIARKQTP
jgi:alpha-glucosidase (family GH31 glycosyl hydrolase)